MFADLLATLFDDPDHSKDERRELIIGHSKQHLLIVSFSERHGRVRIIGARGVTARERRDYEQNSKKDSTENRRRPGGSEIHFQVPLCVAIKAWTHEMILPLIAGRPVG